MIGIIGKILVGLINVFLFVLTIRIILSWLVLPPSRPIFYLYKITDPVLDFAKKYFPLRIGILDLSIIFPFLFLTLLSKIILEIMVMGRPFTLFYMIGLLLFCLDSIIGVVIFALILFCVVVIIVSFISPYSYNPIVTAVKSIISPILIRFRRILRINHKHADTIYLIIMIVILAVAGFFIHQLFLFFIQSINVADLKQYKMKNLDILH